MAMLLVEYILETLLLPTTAKKWGGMWLFPMRFLRYLSGQNFDLNFKKLIFIQSLGKLLTLSYQLQFPSL